MEQTQIPRWKRLTRRIPELMLLLGAGSVSSGVGMMYFPAGLIAAGLFLLAGAVLSMQGEAG